MKRLAFSCLFATALAGLAGAATWEPVGVLQVADHAALVTAVNRLGQLLGNPMIGGMLAGGIAKEADSELFGRARAGTGIAYAQFFDTDALASTKIENLGSALAYAELFPVKITREAFVKANPKCVEENGMLRLGKDYIAFSADGLWAARSARPEQVSLALGRVGEVAKLGDDLARLLVNEKGLRIAEKVVRAAVAEEKSCSVSPEYALSLLSECRDCTMSVRLGENGLDIDCTARTVEGSELAKSGLKGFASDPFAFAGEGDVAAVAYAEDCGMQSSPVESLRQVLGILRKHGFDTSAVNVAGSDRDGRVTVDVAAILKAVEAAGTNALEKVDVETLGKDLEKAFGEDAGKPFAAASKPSSVACAFRGFKPAFAPGVRFQATFPEASGRRPYCVGVTTLVGVLRAVAPQFVAALPEKQRAEAQPMLALLPDEGRGGIGSMAWREGDCHRTLVRISADEIGAIGSCAGAVMGFIAAKGGLGGAGADGDSDDGDDD